MYMYCYFWLFFPDSFAIFLIDSSTVLPLVINSLFSTNYKEIFAVGFRSGECFIQMYANVLKRLSTKYFYEPKISDGKGSNGNGINDQQK